MNFIFTKITVVLISFFILFLFKDKLKEKFTRSKCFSCEKESDKKHPSKCYSCEKENNFFINRFLRRQR